MRHWQSASRYFFELRKAAGLWITLPRELNEWWRQRSQMSLVRSGSEWKIVGEGNGRARIAYARLENGKLAYTLEALASGLPAPGCSDVSNRHPSLGNPLCANQRK